LSRHRSRHVQSLLQKEKGELTKLEQEIVASILDHEMISRDMESALDGQWTLEEQLADRVALIGGS
jgi:uncharacterized membrane protein